jgi:hypothetical protein
MSIDVVMVSGSCEALDLFRGKSKKPDIPVQGKTAEVKTAQAFLAQGNAARVLEFGN